jgi:YegS/Rv2252/BmrU family lipid kinase
MRYLIVANPTAGRRRRSPMAERVRQRLIDAGAECDLSVTTHRGDAERIVAGWLATEGAASPARRCVVACGGDGTVQEVVHAMLATPSDTVLGLLPSGRCNDFASAMSLCGDERRMTETLLGGRTRRVDVGRVNGRAFCSIAAMGFDAAVARLVNDSRLPLKGSLAYLLGVLRVLWTYRPVSVRLTLDDEHVEGPIFLAATANTATYGGRMKIAPGARVDDGLLDVCLVSPVSRRRVLRLIPRVIRGEHVSLPEVRMFRVRRMSVASDEPSEVWADGEFVARTPLTIEVDPGALHIVVPA